VSIGVNSAPRYKAGLPLARHHAFSATSVAELRANVEGRLGAVVVKAPADPSLHAFANYYKLSFGELWFCSYGDPIEIFFRESDYFRIQFQHAGEASITTGGLVTLVTSSQACISSADAKLAFGEGFQQLVWRVSRSQLSRKLAEITGRPVNTPLEFEPALDLNRLGPRPIADILEATVRFITDSPDEPNRFLLAELEQSLMVALLTGCDHNLSHLLRPDELNPAHRLVRVIEDYIEANLDKPFDIESALSLTGCSARTIYRAFRRSRGYSPIEFSRQRRLAEARELLLKGSLGNSVTDLARRCGFADVSNFSRNFTKAFGESPSSARSACRIGGTAKKPVRHQP
jgi:AraC-like DNA-binding protein